MDNTQRKEAYDRLWQLADAAIAESKSNPPPPPDPLAAKRMICEAIQLDILGEWEDNEIEIYSSYHRKTRKVRSIDKLGYLGLRQIAGPPMGEKVHVGNTDIAGLWRFSEVKEAIADLAGAYTLKDDTICGRGVWLGKDDNGHPTDELILVGAGEGALWDGKNFSRIEHPRRGSRILKFTGAGDWYDFGMLGAYIRQSADPAWCRGVVDELESHLAEWHWQAESSPLMLTGLIMATWLQSIWEWRPQVVVTGQTNSGKTYLVNTLERLFGGLCERAAGASTTEAGIRQTISFNSPAFILDEWDKARHRRKILDFIRNASRSDRTLVGTSGQKSVQANSCQIFWLAGIMSGLDQAADINRFVAFETLPPKHGAPRLEMRPHDYLADLGQKLLAISIRHWQAAKDLAGRLRLMGAAGADHRVVESFSGPIALLACVRGYSDEAASEMLKVMISDIAEYDDDKVTDESDLLKTITSTSVDGGRSLGNRTVGDLIDLSWDTSHGVDADVALGRMGLGVSVFTAKDSPERENERCLIVCHQVVSRVLLKGTEWEGKTIRQILKRIPHAIKSKRRVGGTYQNCFLFPLSVVEELATGKRHGIQDLGF